MNTKILVLLVLCMLVNLLGWGFQAPLTQAAQRAVGPWRALVLAAVGWAAAGILVGLAGLTLYGEDGNAPSWMQPRALCGIVAGGSSCIGSVGMILAFAVAAKMGNNHGAAWISPAVVAVLPAFYVVASCLVLEKPPNGGYVTYLNPGFLIGLALSAAGAALMMSHRP